MRRIDEQQAADLVAIVAREHAHHDPAERMADQQVRRNRPGAFEQDVQLRSDAPRRPRRRAGVAPAEPRAIVTADTRHIRATSGCTSDQLTEDAPSAASSTTVGAPSPAQSQCSRDPPTSIKRPGADERMVNTSSASHAVRHAPYPIP